MFGFIAIRILAYFFLTEPAMTKSDFEALKESLKHVRFQKTGELISETYEINFNSAESESTLREVKRTFNFIRSAENNLDCLLKLESKIEKANQFSPYQEHSYLVRKTFVADF